MKPAWPKLNYSSWEGFEQSLRSKQDGGSVNVQNLGPVTGLRDRPLIRPMRPIPKALLSYSPMDDLSLLQITNFLGECDCTPRGNVEPAKRPVRESENESGPVTPPAKRPKLAHIPPVLSEPFVSSKSAATNSSYTSSSGSSGSSRSSTHSTPKTVVHDKAPAPAARSHQTPTPAKAKSMATPATSRPVPKVSGSSVSTAMVSRPSHTHSHTPTSTANMPPSAALTLTPTQSALPAQTSRPPRPTRLPSTISSQVLTTSPQSPAPTQSPQPPTTAHLPRPPATARLPRPPRLPHAIVPGRDVVPPQHSANSKHGVPSPRPTHSPQPPTTKQTPRSLAPAQPPQSPELAVPAQPPISHLQKAEKARQPLQTPVSVDNRAPAIEPVKGPQPRPMSNSRWDVKIPAATAVPATTAPATTIMTQQQQPSQTLQHLPGLQYLPGLHTPLPQPLPTLQPILPLVTDVDSAALSSSVDSSAPSPSVDSAVPDDVSMYSLISSSYNLSLMMFVAYELAKTDDSSPEELGTSLDQAVDKVLEIAKHLGPTLAREEDWR